MKNILLTLIVFGLVGCNASQNSMESIYQQRAYSEGMASWFKYQKDKNPNKVLIRTISPVCSPYATTSNPFRAINSSYDFFCVGSNEKYYFGSQENIIFSIIEAFFKCNFDHHNIPCEIVRIKDFDALESEKLFWNAIGLNIEKYFQITIQNDLGCIEAYSHPSRYKKVDENFYKCPNRQNLNVKIRRNDVPFEIVPPKSVKKYL